MANDTEAWKALRHLRTAQGALGQAEGSVDSAFQCVQYTHIQETIRATRMLMNAADELLDDAIALVQMEDENASYK